MPHRGPNVQVARKVYAYEGWQQNLSWWDIRKEDHIKFGTQHRKLSRRSIQHYVSNGEKLRNAAYVKPKIYKAPHRKSMTVPQRRQNPPKSPKIPQKTYGGFEILQE